MKQWQKYLAVSVNKNNRLMEQWIVFNNGINGIMKGMVVYADGLEDAKHKANTLKPATWDDLNVMCRFTKSESNPFKSKIFQVIMKDGHGESIINQDLLSIENYEYLSFVG